MDFESVQFMIEIEDSIHEMNMSINNHLAGLAISNSGVLNEAVTVKTTSNYLNAMKLSMKKLIATIVDKLEYATEYAKEIIYKKFQNFFVIKKDMLQTCRDKDLSQVKLKTYTNINNFYNDYIRIYKDRPRINELSIRSLEKRSTNELEAMREVLQEEYATANRRMSENFIKTKNKLFGKDIIVRGIDFQTLSRLAISCNLSNWNSRIDRLKFAYKGCHYRQLSEVTQFDVLSDNPNKYIIVDIFRLSLNLSLKESIVNLNNFRRLMAEYILVVNNMLYRCVVD